MRVLVVILSLLVGSSAVDARPRRPAKEHKLAVREDDQGRKPRPRGQSVGKPWEGSLRNASRLRLGDGAHIRRPHRVYGTRTTVEFTQNAITDVIERFKDTHDLAIGDISAEHGGWISDHHSHQSGRDVDLGLFYNKKPPGYPMYLADANEKNLDCARTWALLSNITRTVDKDGGVQVIYLDYDVQGILYRWAKKKGISDKRLDRIFQYAHGRGAGGTIVRHYRNHANHLHVRYRCSEKDKQCN